MTHTDLKAHLALLKDVATDALKALNEDEARTAFDVSHIAAPREASFRFAFSGPVTTTLLRALLARISWKHNVDPGYVMVSTEDFRALNEETAGKHRTGITIMRISNDHTDRSVRVIASPDIEEGEVVFGMLYVPPVASVVDADSSERTPATMPS